MENYEHLAEMGLMLAFLVEQAGGMLVLPRMAEIDSVIAHKTIAKNVDNRNGNIILTLVQSDKDPTWRS